jgi:hypothetical protein
MPGNTNFGMDPSQNYNAVSVEKRISKIFYYVVGSVYPLLALIKEHKLNFTTDESFVKNNPRITVDLNYEKFAGMTAASMGVPRDRQLPIGFPNYQPFTGLTKAEFPITHWRQPLPETYIQKNLLGNTPRGDPLEEQARAFSGAWARVLAEALSGNQNASETNFLGLEYLLSATNTVGNINQALAVNEWWRANLKTSIGTLTAPILDALIDICGTKANEKGESIEPDLIMADFNSTLSVYGLIRQFFAKTEIVVNRKFHGVYGIKNFEYADCMVVKDNMGPGGTVKVLPSQDFGWAGMTKPELVHDIPILGSDANEKMYTMLGCFYVKNLNRMCKGSGITA